MIIIFEFVIQGMALSSQQCHRKNTAVFLKRFMEHAKHLL